MSHLYILAFVSIWIYECSAITLQQPQLSLTKLGSGRNTAHIKCKVEGSGGSQYVHWYQHKKNKPPKRILYVEANNPVHDTGFDKEKFDAEQIADVSTLTINHVSSEDFAMYYCACWDKNWIKYFGQGTKLVVLDQSSPIANAPKPKILHPSPAEIKQTGKGTYLCHLADFFPDVIKVTWTEDGKTTELKAEMGEIEKGSTAHLYSVSSWLTVPKQDLNKIYVCTYQHEGNQTPENKKHINTKVEKSENGHSIKPTIEAVGPDCVDRYDNSTEAIPAIAAVKPSTFRVAYFTYLLLLLKSGLYCIIILCFVYRIGAVSPRKGKNLAT